MMMNFLLEIMPKKLVTLGSQISNMTSIKESLMNLMVPIIMSTYLISSKCKMKDQIIHENSQMNNKNKKGWITKISLDWAQTKVIIERRVLVPDTNQIYSIIIIEKILAIRQTLILSDESEVKLI